MSARDCFIHCHTALTKSELLRPFLAPENIIVGDRKHGDDLQKYEIRIYPTSQSEPRGDRTMEHRASATGGVEPTATIITGRPRRVSEAVVIHRFGVELWVREPDPVKRILGAGARAPGILDFIELFKAALTQSWDFKSTIQALEFDSFDFNETFPPPRATSVVIVEENIVAQTRNDPQRRPPWFNGEAL